MAHRQNISCSIALHTTHPIQGQTLILISLFSASSTPATSSSRHTAPQLGRPSSSGSITRVCNKPHNYGQLSVGCSDEGLPCKVKGICNAAGIATHLFDELADLGISRLHLSSIERDHLFVNLSHQCQIIRFGVWYRRYATALL